MSDQLITSVVTVLMAIVGVAIIAVLVSKNANTTGVIGAGASGFSQALGTALSPVTGGGGMFGSFNPGGGASYLG
jgi:membrane DNA delivery protein